MDGHEHLSDNSVANAQGGVAIDDTTLTVGKDNSQSIPVTDSMNDSWWREYGWSRPRSFVRNLTSTTEAPESLIRQPSATMQSLVFWTDVSAALKRHSLRQRAVAFPEGAFQRLVGTLMYHLSIEPFLFAGTITVGVPGWRDQAACVEIQPRHLDMRTSSVEDGDLLELVQGQQWILGPGPIFIIGIDWRFAERMGISSDLAYAHALVACGRIGHALLLDGQRLDVQGRMTPALKETVASRLLSLDSGRDGLYVLKLASVQRGHQ